MNFHEYAAKRGATPEMIDQAHKITLDRIEAYRLAQARKDRSMTQKELADAMDVAQARVSQIENGDIGSARVDTIRKYVEALGATFTMSAEWPDKTIRLA